MIERLNGGLAKGGKLTIISTPAGFGKTRLVSEWIAQCGRPAAWLSWDERDSDLTRFLSYVIAALQTIKIASREDPHLPIAQLRAHGQLTELRASDLCFTSAEAAEFLNRVMELNLFVEDISALETCTEGWIAGLQLAALSTYSQLFLWREQHGCSPGHLMLCRKHPSAYDTCWICIR